MGVTNSDGTHQDRRSSRKIGVKLVANPTIWSHTLNNCGCDVCYGSLIKPVAWTHVLGTLQFKFKIKIKLGN